MPWRPDLYYHICMEVNKVNNINEIPSIVISSNECNPRILREIKAGIEEEGIPYSEYEVNDDIMKSSYNAALMSKFGIGIAAYNGHMIMHYNKLPENEPLFELTINNDDFQIARNFGSNAARLYKGLPFKPLKKDAVESDVLEKIVNEVVKQYISSNKRWR